MNTIDMQVVELNQDEMQTIDGGGIWLGLALVTPLAPVVGAVAVAGAVGYAVYRIATD